MAQWYTWKPDKDPGVTPAGCYPLKFMQMQLWVWFEVPRASVKGCSGIKSLLHTRRDSHWPKTTGSQWHSVTTGEKKHWWHKVTNCSNFQLIEASANESAGHRWLTSAADWHKTCPSLECPSAITFVLLSVWTQLKEAQFKVLPHLNPTSSSRTLTTKSLTHTQGTYSELFKAQLSACMCVKWQSAALWGCAS